MACSNELVFASANHECSSIMPKHLWMAVWFVWAGCISLPLEWRVIRTCVLVLRVAGDADDLADLADAVAAILFERPCGFLLLLVDACRASAMPASGACRRSSRGGPFTDQVAFAFHQ